MSQSNLVAGLPLSLRRVVIGPSERPPSLKRVMQVYQAKYSDVLVWVLNVNDVGVMRRQTDGWINATHLLKVANFDKPRRTRILERDVQTGTHEKVQGGYGKYQGTWVPVDRGIQLSKDFGVFESVQILLEYKAQDNEVLPAPPAAARRSTNVSKPPAPKKARKSATAPPKAVVPATAARRESTRRDSSSSSDDTPPGPQASYMDQYSSALLDLFMSPNKKIPDMLLHPRPGYHINQAIDDEGNTVFHWASAMGQVQIMQALIDAKTRLDATNKAGHTPLVRAVLYTNNYDLRSFPHVLELLKSTLFIIDSNQSSLIHQIAHTTSSRSRGSSARYYLENVITKMIEQRGRSFLTQALSSQDNNGDTPLHIAARNDSRKLIKVLMSYDSPSNIVNKVGRTAHEYICEYEAQRKTLASSSPTINSSPTRPPYLRAASSQHHLSQAAVRATRLPSLMAEYLGELANVYEQELKDREADIEQVRSLSHQVQRTSHEISLQLPAMQESCQNHEAKMEKAKTEVQEKSMLLAKIVERSQARDLAMLVTENEQQVEHEISSGMRRESDPQLMATLEHLQKQRQQLVSDIVALYASASSSDKINKYRKLVSLSAGVDVNQIDELLDVFTQALEEPRR